MGNSDSGYKYDKSTEELKSYKIGEKQIVTEFNNYKKEVISPVEGTNGKERFYVMALKDLDGVSHYWYYNAYGYVHNIEENTDVDFTVSNGKTKTEEMLQKYEDQEYGEPKIGIGYSTDLWGLATLKEKVAQGWFVPSRAEWSAFGDMLYTSDCLPDKVTSSNYVNYGLRAAYWASSALNGTCAWKNSYVTGYVFGAPVTQEGYVRLSTIF